jgi:hypothetical protein
MYPGMLAGHDESAGEVTHTYIMSTHTHIHTYIHTYIQCMYAGMLAGHDESAGEVMEGPDGKKRKLFYGI